MADLSELKISEHAIHQGRPSLAQLKALTEYMQKSPNFAYRNFKYVRSHEKLKKFWIELTKNVNSIRGTVKTTKGWVKFWSDKRRIIEQKQRKIREGKIQDKLTEIEQKILNIYSKKKIPKKSKLIKVEPCNGHNNTMDNVIKNDAGEEQLRMMQNKADLIHLNIMERMVDAMHHQSTSLAQAAQVSMSNSKVLKCIAEASQQQAQAVKKLVSTFETVGASLHDLCNVVMNIDYTIKRCYTTTQRQNSILFN